MRVRAMRATAPTSFRRKRRTGVAECRIRLAATAVTAGRLHRGMPRPAVIEPLEDAVSRVTWMLRVHPRRDLSMVNDGLVLVELPVQHEDARGHSRPGALDVRGRKLAEEPLGPSGIGRRRRAQRAYDDPAHAGLFARTGANTPPSDIPSRITRSASTTGCLLSAVSAAR